MTPLHLKIAIHYHTCADQWSMLDVEIHRQYAGDLAAAGLLRLTCDGTADHPSYEKTDGLAVWINALCSTPLPTQQWVMPGRERLLDRREFRDFGPLRDPDPAKRFKL